MPSLEQRPDVHTEVRWAHVLVLSIFCYCKRARSEAAARCTPGRTPRCTALILYLIRVYSLNLPVLDLQPAVHTEARWSMLKIRNFCNEIFSRE